VLVHVPLVQEIAGLRRKKPAKPKPPNHGRIAKFYRSQAEAAQRFYPYATTQSPSFFSSGCVCVDFCGNSIIFVQSHPGFSTLLPSVPRTSVC
jgi:hypothetical protein